MTTPVHLIHTGASREVAEVLTGLLEAAHAGQITGLVFGVSLRGQKFLVDAAGSLHRNPVTGVGVATMLTVELEHRIRRKATDTLM